MGFKWWTPRASLNIYICIHPSFSLPSVLRNVLISPSLPVTDKGLEEVTVCTHWFTHAVSLWDCKISSWCLFLQHFMVCPFSLKNGPKSCPTSQQQKWTFSLHQSCPEIGDLRHRQKSWLVLESTTNYFCYECLLTRRWRVPVYLKAL